MNIPDVDGEIYIDIDHWQIKQEYKKIDHYVNAEARYYPEVRPNKKIFTVIF